MEYKVIILPQVRKELRGIFFYILETSKNILIAQRFIHRLANEIMGLSFMPRINPLIHEEPLRSQGIRAIIYKKYFILYRIDEKEKTVSVVRVFHSKLNYPGHI